MANLKIEISKNGNIKYNLEFLGGIYEQRSINLQNGTILYTETIRHIVEKELGEKIKNIIGPEETKELLQNVDEIDDLNLIEAVSDNIKALTEYEQLLQGKQNELQ